MKSFLQIFLLIFLGIGVRLNAQNYIKIYDAESLEALAYANVKITDLSTNESVQTISNDLGEIAIPFLNDVVIEISYVGYESFRKQINPKRTGILYIFPLDQVVDEIVVTGNTTETVAKESMYEVKLLAKEDIEKRAAVNLSDALMTELNVQINTDGVLGTQLSLQGLGGNNVKIMMDGVPIIGRLDGNIDLSQINLNNIERIEIVEGPLSAVYGSNAIAGVINLISKQNQKKKIEASANSYYESIGTYNFDGFLGFKIKQHLVQLNGGRYFFDGWNPGSYDRDVQWNPKEQYFGDISYLLRTKKDWFVRFKASYFEDKILNRFDPSGVIPKAFDDWYFTRRIDFTNTTNGKINDNLSLNSTNSFNSYTRIKNKYQKDLSTLESVLVLDSEGEDNQDTTQAMQWMSRSFISYKNPSKLFDFQTGIDFNIENGIGGRFSDEDGSAALIADLAFFYSSNFQFNEKIKLQAAIRYGYNSKFKTLPTPSLLFKYNVNSKLQVRLNYGMGFRAPSLKEMYLVFNDANHDIFGNKNLTPEQSQNLSASVQYEASKKLHHYSLGSKLFYTYKYNAIALTPDENNVFQYVNIAQVSSTGSELNASYQFKDLSINFGFSYIGLASQNSNNKFYFYPQMQSSISYFIRKANLSFSLINKWNGARKDFRISGVDNNEVEIVNIQAYDLMNFSMQKTFWKERISINCGIKNLLNVSNVNGTSSDGAHSGSNQSQIAAGRSYFVGLKIGTGR
ncbi:MAG: TonB-dependent receptor [Chitinophagales bacterium]|nr:TonB-dependent receptor [Chitinophagales bacterium]